MRIPFLSDWKENEIKIEENRRSVNRLIGLNKKYINKLNKKLKELVDSNLEFKDEMYRDFKSKLSTTELMKNIENFVRDHKHDRLYFKKEEVNKSLLIVNKRILAIEKRLDVIDIKLDTLIGIKK